MKKTVEATMSPVPDCNLTVAPAFSPLHKRTIAKIWLAIFCRCSTSAVSIKIMDDYSTDAFISSFTRFSTTYGFLKKLFCDSGIQLVKGCDNMRRNFNDIQFQLHKRVAVELTICPVGGHSMNGQVERKIREISYSIEKNAHNERLSLMHWETLVAFIANNINNLPIGIGSKVDVENRDLITPNRLLLG